MRLFSVVIYFIFFIVKWFFVQLILFLSIFYYNNIFSVSFDFTVAWYTTLVCRQLSFSGYAGGILFFLKHTKQKKLQQQYEYYMIKLS